MARRRVASINHVTRSKIKVTFLVLGFSKTFGVRPIYMVLFVKYLAQIIIMARQRVANKVTVASSKIKVIVGTPSLFVFYNGSLFYPARS